MRLRYELLVLLTLIILNNVIVTYAQFERHTPGFPNKLLDELLSNIGLDPRLLNVLNDVARSAVAGELTDTDIARALSSTLASGAPDEDVVTALNTLSKFYELSESGIPIPPDVLYNLVNSINDVDLRNELKALIDKYASGLVTPQDVEAVLRKIESSYIPRDVSLKDLLVATKTSQLVGRSIGCSEVGNLVEKVIENMRLDGLIDVKPETIESLEKLLKTFKPPSKAPELSSFVPSLGDISNAFSKSLSPSTGFSAPSVGLAVPSLQLPRIDLSLLTYVAVPIAVILCCIILARLLKISPRIAGLASFKQLPKIPTDFTELRAAIRNYWTAVRFMESRHGVVRQPWETHREYLSRVLGVDKQRAFEGLTEAYELAKYAQVESKDVDERSEAYLKELIGGKQ